MAQLGSNGPFPLHSGPLLITARSSHRGRVRRQATFCLSPSSAPRQHVANVAAAMTERPRDFGSGRRCRTFLATR